MNSIRLKSKQSHLFAEWGRRFLLSGGLRKGTYRYRKLISRTFPPGVEGEGKGNAPNSRRLIWGRNRYESEKPWMTSVCVEMSFHENFGLGNPINPSTLFEKFSGRF
ncbi:hypothetical protein CDAR_54851 [Caerostris darwini]|uniref:Uncharacterized protein n=1 Tax=Caerostris darwini TaxID=1538125 RepID=A0AAV4NE21_9ARAC|nr:hypothetical protein CDAR_54851 [Caerostris darwini]